MLKITIEIEGLDELLGGAVAMVANWDRPEVVGAVDQVAKTRRSAKTKAAEPSPDYRDEVEVTTGPGVVLAEKSPPVVGFAATPPEVAGPPVAETWMTPEAFHDYVGRFIAAPPGGETPAAQSQRLAQGARLKAIYEKYFPGQKRSDLPDTPVTQRKFAAIVADFQAAEAAQL